MRNKGGDDRRDERRGRGEERRREGGDGQTEL